MRAMANCVHSSFRHVERAADWLTGAAGPVFIAICITLVGGGVWTFFSTMFLQLAPAPPELAKLFHTYSPAHIALGLMPTLFDSVVKDPLPTLRFFFWLAFCFFIVYSIGWHYYMACTIPPGTVADGLADAVPERRSGPGSTIWWARYRKRAAKASGDKVAPLQSAASPDAVGEAPEPAAPVRVSSVADLKKLNQALDGLDTKRARSPSAASLPGSRSSSERLPPVVGTTLPPSHRSRSGSGTATPRASKTDLPLSIHDLGPSNLVTSPAPIAESSSQPFFPPNNARASRSSDSLARPAHDHDSDDEHDHLDEDDDDLFPLAGMCCKCPTVPLFKALTMLPPELRKIEKQMRTNPGSRAFTSKLAADDIDEGEAEVRAWLGPTAAEALVPPPKPERAHHCRTCKVCTLKFDHHCPWLNQCVGLGNERYFVLFMSWLSFGCGVVLVSGWKVVRMSISWSTAWPYPYTPRVFVMLLYMLALVMGLALFVMAGWQMVLISRGETSVESQDNAHYKQLAKKRGQEFTNVYDVGRRRNIELFFNVGPGSPYGWHTIFLPMRVPPYSDGWHWAKRRGLRGKHGGIELQEQLTDDEFEDDHYDNNNNNNKSKGSPEIKIQAPSS